MSCHLHPPGHGCGFCLDELRARAERAEAALEGITATFERVIREDDNRLAGYKGLQVSFHGDFNGIWQLPSCMGAIRWWARELREALTQAKPAGGGE